MWVILKEPLNHSGPQFPQLDSSLSRHHGFYLFSGSRVKGKCEPQVTFREGHPGLRVNEDSRTRDITCQGGVGVRLSSITQISMEGRKSYSTTKKGQRDLLFLSGFTFPLPQRMSVHLHDCCLRGKKINNPQNWPGSSQPLQSYLSQSQPCPQDLHTCIFPRVRLQRPSLPRLGSGHGVRSVTQCCPCWMDTFNSEVR